MEKNVIEVVLRPEVKKEKEYILLLFRKKKFILLVTLMGLIIGSVVSSLYYLNEGKKAAEISSAQPSDKIPGNLYDRQFLSQPTREREPGNLHISEQLRYDVFGVNKTMSDVIIYLSKSNHAAEKADFEAFQSLATRKLAIEAYSQFQSVNLEAFAAKIDDYLTKYPYLLVNDDKEVLKAKIRENQSIIDTYNLAIISANNNIDYAQVLINIESLSKTNKVLEQLIQGNATDDPDPRGTRIAAAQIDALCINLDEVKLELLDMIDKNLSTASGTNNLPSLLKVVAIGAIFPCMMFIAAILLVMLSDWWYNFLKEQNKAIKTDSKKE